MMKTGILFGMCITLLFGCSYENTYLESWEDYCKNVKIEEYILLCEFYENPLSDGEIALCHVGGGEACYRPDLIPFQTIYVYADNLTNANETNPTEYIKQYCIDKIGHELTIIYS